MNKRLYIVALIVALVFSLLTVTVNAASGFKANLNSSSSSVAKGNEVTITLNISDFEDNIEKGISSVTGKISVDDKVFESLTSDSFEGSGDWKVSFDESTGELTCKNLKTVKKAQDICEITVKAKSSTSETEGAVKITNLKATDADAELTAEDASTTLTIGTSRIGNISNRTNSNTNSGITRIGNNTNTNSVENTNVNTNSNTNLNINTNTNSNTNSSRYNTVNNANTNNSAEEKMPNTGLDDSIVKAIILVAIVGLFGYIKVKSLDRE